MKKTLPILAFLLLISTVLTFVPVKAPNPIFKVGIIGPQGLPHWGIPGAQAGMWPAAQMAAAEINAAGGVNVGGTMYDIQLVPGNEYAVTGPGGTPEPAKAAAEVVKLITVDGVKFLIGGFRTECTGPMIEKAMDYNVPFFIDGASTDELISTTVREPPGSYARYKYLFRNMPMNTTTLFSCFAAFLKLYCIPKVLLPLYGDYLWPGAPNKQVRVAVLCENLTWTAKAWMVLTNPAIYPGVLGPNANVTFSALVDPLNPGALPGVLTGVINSKARLMIHIFSAPIGVALIKTWATMGVQALPVGINVMAQLQTHWASTTGGCEYECILDTSGTRTPIVPVQTVLWWDKFVATYGAWPLYTAWGAYDSLYGLKDALERAGAAALSYITDPGPPPYGTSAPLVPFFETTDRIALNGRFRYTKDHDVFCTLYDLGPIHLGNTRPMVVQWQAAGPGAGTKEVVWPYLNTYSRMVRLPAVMYPLITDINYDGKVDIKDVAMAAKAFGSYPGHENWRMEADLPPCDGKIDIKDIARIAKDFGKYVTLPLP